MLKNFNLTIEKGSFVAILGHNGSGKSTTAKLINGINIAQSGEVIVDGQKVVDDETIFDIRRKVGMVFQNPDNQIVSSIVEEDVAFGVENLGVEPEEIRKRVDNALKTVGMYEYRLKAPNKLSGGQKQRVAVAGIIAMKPMCIVLDEPTAMLDPSGRKEVFLTTAGAESLPRYALIAQDGGFFEFQKPERVLDATCTVFFTHHGWSLLCHPG